MAYQAKAEDLFNIMVTLFSIATAPVAIPMILGLLSKSFTERSALWGFLLGLLLGLVLFGLSYYPRPFSVLFVEWTPEKDQIAFFGYAASLEMVLFLATSLTTFFTMVLITLLNPMKQKEKEHIEPFLRRLEIPIGTLPEEKDSQNIHSGVSPFRIVGVSLIIIAGMMMAVLPWSGNWTTFILNAIIGVFLVVVGLALALSGRRKPLVTE